MTMIVVTHEMNVERSVSTEVVFLHNGLIANQGAPAHMFNNPQTAEFKRIIAKT